ncbi:MAG: SCO family protein [Pseudoprimorskyibacter sp.]|jgi:protein SCO1/2|nr:SCO family protein [Pseudoprimorskyibacter sp.]
MIRIAALSAAVAATALIGATAYVTFSQSAGNDPFHSCRTSVVAGGSGTIGGPFTLVNTRSETVTDIDVITQPSIVYFGYTFCPDVCPLDTVRNADSVDILSERGRQVTPVFISVDPKRDTPEVLAEFTSLIHDQMIGLTGTPEQIQDVTKAYRVVYRAHDDGTDFYLVDHMTFSYLVLPDHGFVEFFRNDLSPEALANKMECFIKAA